MHDVIIVGSGASGVAAALELSRSGIKPLLLDVGHQGSSPATIDQNFYEYRRAHDAFDLMIGAEGEGLSNLLGRTDVPVKLTAPFTQYVTRDADRIAPVDETDFSAIQSFARGGLANAWGAGLYRFVAEDMRDFPFGPADLDPYFERLTEHIGIAGISDDLAPYFGPADGLTMPVPLSRNISDFYERYRRRKKPNGNIHVGRARVAVRTGDAPGAPQYKHHALEFFQADRSIYSPRYTLDTLVTDGRVEVESGVVVTTWQEHENHVVVRARDLSTSETRSFSCKTLLLAAGAINTTRIVLASAEEYTRELPLLENPALQIPLVLPRAIGRRLDTRAFGLVQLNLVWNSEAFGRRLQGSIMEITAPSRAEFFGSFPLSARANLGLIRQLLPGMLVMQLFFPGDALAPAALSLRPDGSLAITGAANTLELPSLRPLFRFLRRMGALTLPQLVVRVPMGHAVHYTSTLPMKHDPAEFECYPDGRLFGTRAVYVADSAGFTSLAAKNMSFAMMANAMRVASQAAREHAP